MSKWTAVEDGLPASGDDVLVWADWGGNSGQVRHAVFVAPARGERGRYARYVFAPIGPGEPFPVTHWMPVPDGPHAPSEGS